MRSGYLLLVVGSGMIVVAGAAFAGLPTPTSSPGNCKNDGGVVTWNYNYDGGVPDGATVTDGGVVILPSSACISITENDSDHYKCNPDGVCPNPPLPNPPQPGCNPMVGGPNCPTAPTLPGGATVTWARPTNPYGQPGVPQPNGTCGSDTGWSFEDGTFQGWVGAPTKPGATSVFIGITDPRGYRPAAPVYGNNVEINRINPPGYVDTGANSARDNVGGDYWQYSRDINYHGDYWIGSSDYRPDWKAPAGGRWAETGTGTLTSPMCQLNANYVSFKIGGSSSNAQRVELEVLPISDGPALAASYQGIGNVEKMAASAPGPLDLPTDQDNGWIIVRAATNNDPGENDYMSRRVVWDVSKYIGHQVRLRVVDDVRNQQGHGEHINVDDFRFANQPVDNAAWLPFFIGDCGLTGCPGTWTQSFVASVMRPQPIWGTTDAHTHGTSNMSFGGHVFWGDISDTLDRIYTCALPLPAIKDNAGHVIRPASSTLNGGTSIEANCAVNVDIVAMLLGEVLTECKALDVVPWVGWALAAACDVVAVAASGALAVAPVLNGWTIHGGTKLSSGTLRLGKWLTAGLPDDSKLAKPIQGAIPLIDHNLLDGSHSGTGLGVTHQMYQYQMVQRAYQGGLRVIVMDAINSRALQMAVDGETNYSDWQAIADSIATMKRLTARPGDVQFPSGGVLFPFAEIAYTPTQARQIIRRNKVAVIMGVEVDELGKPRPWVTGDSMARQVDDLYAMGIRKITPVHGTNNPIGGAAVFNDVYNSANYFDNLNNGHWVNWNPESTAVKIYLSSFFPLPFAGMYLGDWQVAQTWSTDSTATFPCDVNCATQNANRDKNGWFQVVGDASAEKDWIGHYDDITFRFGYAFPEQELQQFSKNGAGYQWNRVDMIQPTKFLSLDWMIGGSLSASNRCDLTNTMFPLKPAILPVDDEYQALGHQWNSQGLTIGPESGETFVNQIMTDGMLMDVDHFSQRSRVRVYELTRSFGQDANGVSKPSQDGYDYPLFGVHTGLRGYERTGPVPYELRDQGGFVIENDRTAEEISRAGANGGSIALLASGSTMIPPWMSQPLEVQNNCDYSSKTWAVKYLAMMKLMKGKGLLPSTDMDGLTTPMASRYGWANPNHNACHQSPLSTNLDPVALPRETRLGLWPRDFANQFAVQQPESYHCMENSLNAGDPGHPWDPSCPSTQMVNGQLAEHSAVYYDDYDSRGPVVSAFGNGQSDLFAVKARGASDLREDRMPRAAIDEYVTYSNARQRRPMKRFRTKLAGWDFNLDSLAHIGLFPDFFQDVHNVGVTWEQMGPLFNAAEDFVETWERACQTATKYRQKHAIAGQACQ